MSLRDEQRLERMKEEKSWAREKRRNEQRECENLMQGGQMKGFLQLRGGEETKVQGQTGREET